MTSQSDDKVIDKIRKLLALAERGGTEAEADAAMAKVQEMLTQHNLDIDAVRGEKEATMTREYREYPWNQSWIREVYKGVAKLYFCKFYFTPNGTECQYCYLIGEPVNIHTAQFVADVVIATGNRLAKEYATAARKEFLEFCDEDERSQATGKAISASNDFKKGYGLRINHRCWELKRAATKPTTTDAKVASNALVVKNFYEKNDVALKAYQEKIGLKLVSGAGMNGAGNANHAQAGAKAANSVNLRAGGVGGSKTMLIGGGK